MAHQITRLSVALGMALGLMGATGCTRSITSTPGDAPNLQKWVDTIKNKGPEREREPLPLLTEQEVFSYADNMTVSINPNPESAIARAGASSAPVALDAKVLEALGVENSGAEAAKSWLASSKAFHMDASNPDHAKIFLDKLSVASGVSVEEDGTVAAAQEKQPPEESDDIQESGDKSSRKRIRAKVTETDDDAGTPAQTEGKVESTVEDAAVKPSPSTSVSPTNAEKISGVAGVLEQVAQPAQKMGLSLDQTLALIQALKHAGRGDADVVDVLTQLSLQDSALQGWERVTAAQQSSVPLLTEALSAGTVTMAKAHEAVLANTGGASSALINEALHEEANLIADTRPLRSPFDLPQTDTGNRSKQALRPDSLRPKQALESFPLDSLAMVGTIGKGPSMVALVMSPDKVVYRVGHGQYLGQQDGRVTGIDEGQIQLVELIQDGSGGWVEQSASIVLTE